MLYKMPGSLLSLLRKAGERGSRKSSERWDQRARPSSSAWQHPAPRALVCPGANEVAKTGHLVICNDLMRSVVQGWGSLSSGDCKQVLFIVLCPFLFQGRVVTRILAGNFPLA